MKAAVLSFRREFGPAIFPLFPRHHEFATLPEFEQIITSPLPQVVTLDTFSSLAPMIPRYLETWKQETLRSLEVLLRYSIDSELPEGVRATDLAVGQFLQCALCTSVLDIQRAPHHECLEVGHLISGRTDYELALREATKSPRHIHFRPLTDFLRDLLEQCGQDYRRLTPQDMDKLEILFFCRACTPDYWRLRHETRKIMNWRAAVRVSIFVERNELTSGF